MASAVTSRFVIGFSSMRSSECTLPTTRSRRARSAGVLVEGAIAQDVDLDPGQDPERRQLVVQLRHFVELLLQALRGQPVGDRQPRRVVGEHHVLVAQLAGGLRHLADRRAAIRPVGVDVAVAAQCGAQRGAQLGDRLAAGRLQAAQVDRLLAAQRFGDGARQHLADARQVAKRPAPGPLCQLGRRHGRHHRRRVPEGSDPKGRLAGDLQQEGDPPQVSGGVARLGHARYSMVRMRRGLSIVICAISPSPTAAVRRLGQEVLLQVGIAEAAIRLAAGCCAPRPG